MDEQRLIYDAQKGDLEAFNRLVFAYQDVIYTHAFRMLGDESAADDAAQETFIAAYKAICTFRGGSFRAWLFRIATNQCYDELRRRQRRPTTPLEPFTLMMKKSSLRSGLEMTRIPLKMPLTKQPLKKRYKNASMGCLESFGALS